MGVHYHYSVRLIQQFFATLDFEDNETLTLKWMKGNNMRESNFYEFTHLLSYPFHGYDVSCGHWLHHHGAHPKKQ
jgi:hypothetical protein